jgi:hypothetical protein
MSDQVNTSENTDAKPADTMPVKAVKVSKAKVAKVAPVKVTKPAPVTTKAKAAPAAKPAATKPAKPAPAPVTKAAKAKPAAKPAKAAPKAKAVRVVAGKPAAYGSKAEIIVKLGQRAIGFTAAELREATGWRSVSAKAIATRFGATHDLKPVAVERKDGQVAYRLA